MPTTNENTFTREKRMNFWKQLKCSFPNGRTPNEGKNQYFEFKYLGLALRVDVYIRTKDINNYGGNVVVSFDTVTFKGSGFIIPDGNTPDIHYGNGNGNGNGRIYFFKSINLKKPNGFEEAIKWICGVVVTIASLYNAVNCE